MSYIKLEKLKEVESEVKVRFFVPKAYKIKVFQNGRKAAEAIKLFKEKTKNNPFAGYGIEIRTNRSVK